MADTNMQSSDRSSLDTNPNTARVLYRGSTQVTTASSGSIFVGSVGVDLQFLKGTVLNPVVHAYWYSTGPGVAVLYSIPHINFNTTGTLDTSIIYSISAVGTTDDSLSLDFYVQADRATTFTIYYVITSMSVSTDDTLLNV